MEIAIKWNYAKGTVDTKRYGAYMRTSPREAHLRPR